jgi:hypothetical protein
MLGASNRSAPPGVPLAERPLGAIPQGLQDLRDRTNDPFSRHDLVLVCRMGWPAKVQVNHGVSDVQLPPSGNRCPIYELAS